MARRKRTSGKSKKKRRNKKTSPPRKKTQPIPVKYLSRYRIRYPDRNGEWSPWVCSSLLRKLVKGIESRYVWVPVASFPESEKIAKASREEFEIWHKQQMNFITSP